jgi:hypothetical protein
MLCFVHTPFSSRIKLISWQIAAAGDGESNMWQHHSKHLLRIITLRRQAYGTEVYDFIVWTICAIDIYALLSANGTGAFIEAILEQKMLPKPERCLPPISSGKDSVIYPEEHNFLAVLSLNQEVSLVALQVGQLARDLRAEVIQRQYGNVTEVASETQFLAERKFRIAELRSRMFDSESTWIEKFRGNWDWISGPESSPPRVFAWSKHVSFRHIFQRPLY